MLVDVVSYSTRKTRNMLSYKGICYDIHTNGYENVKHTHTHTHTANYYGQRCKVWVTCMSIAVFSALLHKQFAHCAQDVYVYIVDV